MSNPSYWKGRQKKLWEQLEKDEGKLTEKLSQEYGRQVKSFEKEIALYYQKYGQDNVIQYRNLMQQLDADDKKLLIERMEGFGEKYPEYRHLLPVRESIYRLNRLEGLQHSIYIQQLEIGAIDQDALEKHLTKEFERGYTAMAKELGFGSQFYVVNRDLLKKTINARWVGEKNFSERIWGNRTKLADYLNRDFAQAMARGDSYERCMGELKKKFSDVSRKDMYNLIYTEGTYIMNEASITPFEKDFSHYKYSPLMDKKTCSICRGLSGKSFRIGERQPGINFPPMHSRCRCSFTIFISDDFVDRYVENRGGDYFTNQSKKSNNSFDSNVLRNVFHLNFKQKGDTIENNELMMKARTELDKYFQITGLHSDGKNFFRTDNSNKPIEKFTPKRLAEIIRNSKSFNNQDVKIYSCNAGAIGATAAQELSDALGVNIKVPKNYIALFGDGTFHVLEYGPRNSIKKKYDVDDGWIILKPQEGQ